MTANADYIVTECIATKSQWLNTQCPTIFHLLLLVVIQLLSYQVGIQSLGTKSLGLSQLGYWHLGLSQLVIMTENL